MTNGCGSKAAEGSVARLFIEEDGMNKDTVKGKLKDVAGRIERQAGEWTGDPKKQVEGASKQVEGKVQNAWGKAKDAVKNTDNTRTSRPHQRKADSEPESKD